ncbi:MAG: nucleotidyltransferase domain-containing protein [Atribacterota bacterium]
MKKHHRITENNRKKIQKKIAKYLKNEKSIIFAYLHGSFLQKKFRDIDIGIYLRRVFTKKQVLKYELYLETQMSNSFGYEFDVRVLNHAPLSFKYKVIKNSVLLFSKDEKRRVDFESLSFVKYHDFELYRKMYLRDAFGVKV